MWKGIRNSAVGQLRGNERLRAVNVRLEGDKQIVTRHILLVEDDAAVRHTFQRALRTCGYMVTVASDGHHALAIFQERPDRFDLLLSDQVMPGMTGTQLSRRVLDLRPNIPIIVLSGYSGVISDENVQEFGVRKVLRKPIRLAVLQEAVEECLQ